MERVINTTKRDSHIIIIGARQEPLCTVCKKVSLLLFEVFI